MIPSQTVHCLSLFLNHCNCLSIFYVIKIQYNQIFIPAENNYSITLITIKASAFANPTVDPLNLDRAVRVSIERGFGNCFN